MSGVLFDHNAFVRAKRGGVARYFCNIIGHLANDQKVASDVRFRVMAPLHDNDMLSELSLDRLHIKVPVSGRYPSKVMDLVNEKILAGVLRVSKFDVLHETHYSGRTYGKGMPRPIYTVHDLIPEIFPNWFSGYGKILLKRRKAFAMDADFVCVSEKTADDFMNMFKVNEGRVHVIPHGTTFLPKQEGVSRRSDMLLYVGTRGNYKNFTGLVDAFGKTPELASEIELVAFGGGPFTAQERLALAENGVQRYRQVSGDDAQLAHAYAEATLFVYPSFYEGFGLPLLEAMALDCPVACAGASCFPEIAGPAASYFKPDEAGEMGEMLLSLIKDPARRTELVARGQERLALFSWEASAKSHADLYRSFSA
jgi:glycosyltransferase involved in cell wall biosynthesis